MLTRLLSPKAWPLKQDLRDVPMDGLVSEMGDGLNLARLADCNALVLLQDKIVGVVQLGHLVRVRFLDGEEVVALFNQDCGQVSRATACVPAHEEQSPGRL